MESLFDLKNTIGGNYISGFSYVWQALPGLADFIIFTGHSLSYEEYFQPYENVWISKSAKIADNAVLSAPCIIGHDTEVRHCAFIRGSVLIGNSCVIGNSCEIKNSLLFDSVQVPHFNYVGDSVLGCGAHLGAGAITSNLKCDESEVIVRAGDALCYTGLRKFGAAIGDRVQVGCNVTLNPGTVIGKDSIIYPNLSIRGYIPENCICKSMEILVQRKREI